MIFWIIAISYLTVAIVIYLGTIRDTKNIAEGDIVETMQYCLRMSGRDSINLDKLKIGTMSLESSLWIYVLIEAIAWPFIVYLLITGKLSKK